MATFSTSGQEPAEIIEIRDPEVDVDALMTKVRANVAQRRAAGAYSEDLDAIADEVRAASMAEQAFVPGVAANGRDFAATLAELNAHWMVREVPFTSNVPLFGAVIVAVRNAWNWMSTKWYVRPIIQQQVGFNALAVQALNESVAIQQQFAAEVRQLQAEVAVLREATVRSQASETDTGD